MTGVQTCALPISRTASLKVDLYGSLGATGRGHATDQGVILGLLGEAPDTVDPAQAAERLARVRKITANVKDTLERLRNVGGKEKERGFVTHRTLADPRFLDPALDPNDRPIGWCYLGDPETVNSGPVGLARFSTLRSWLSQWSIDDTNADGIKCAEQISAPLLLIENSADDAVPSYHCQSVFKAAGTVDKQYHRIDGATHYYVGQPDHLGRAIDLTEGWLADRRLLGR